MSNFLDQNLVARVIEDNTPSLGVRIIVVGYNPDADTWAYSVNGRALCKSAYRLQSQGEIRIDTNPQELAAMLSSDIEHQLLIERTRRENAVADRWLPDVYPLLNDATIKERLEQALLNNWA